MPIKDLYKILSVTGGLLVILIGAFLYIYFGIESRNQESSQLLSEIQTESIREAKLKTLKDTVANTADKRDELSEYILDSDETVSLIEEIEELGSSLTRQATIQSVQTAPIEGQENFEWVDFTVSALGSWSQILTFVSVMESIPYRTEINSVVLNQDDEEGSSLWQVKIKLKVLKRK